METSYLDIWKILDIDKWQRLQDSLALATKLAIITVDYKGIPVSKHSYPCSFCQLIRSQSEYSKYCFKCDSRGGLEAVRLNAPYIYLCHCNIVDLAIPIMIDGKYIGAVMAGEVVLKVEEENKLEKILTSPLIELFADDDVVQMYKEIPKTTYAEVERSANMLFEISNYIVAEALNKNMILEMYSELVVSSKAKKQNSAVTGYAQDNIKHVKKVIGNAFTDAYVKNTVEDKAICKNPVLRPAFDYIFKNKGEKISQEQMAKLCHLSVSHFSRIFAKEAGESFPAFFSRLKVQWSKHLLENTDLSILQISEELGFSDTSYYIRIFKKFEKITPAVYRKFFMEG